MAAVGVGGVRGDTPPVKFRRTYRARSERPAAKLPPISFWREIFRHINASWKAAGLGDYFWTNADRKILANLARKYGAANVMAMWDLYFKQAGSWFNQSHGSIYGLANDGERIRDLPEFKERAREHQDRIDDIYHLMDAAKILNLVGLDKFAV